MSEPLIDANRVEEITGLCALDPGTASPETGVYIEGIVESAWFDRAKLEEHRDEIRRMLESLPREFMRSGGGGWSFLNACLDANGVQWTSLHRTMSHLFMLGEALGLVSCPLPRVIWPALYGGMPYYIVLDGEEASA